MAYLEIKSINGTNYYYLVKSIRVDPKSWKKVRKYFGSKRPSEDDMIKFESKNVPVTYKYLNEEQAKTLSKIKKKYAEYLKNLPESAYQQFESATLTHFAYNTSAIEGSSMTLPETGFLLEENKTPKGKDMWEIYSALNTKAAYAHMKTMKELSHLTIKKLHEILMKDILEELGEYRTGFMRIGVARHRPPAPNAVPAEMNKLLKWYLKNKDKIHPFELACLFHIKFEGVHPFRDGNGRVGRMLMNFLFLQSGLPLLDIPVEERVEYYQVLDLGQVSKKFKPFVDFAFDIYKKDAQGMGWA